MKKLFQCRRTFIAFVGIVSLTALGLCKNFDVSMAIAGIVTAIAAANGSEAAYKSKYLKEPTDVK